MARLLISLLLAGGLAWGDELPGVLRLGESLGVGLYESGVIAEVAVRPGQQVARGDLLLRLDERDFEARLSAARATLRAAEARHAEARRELERARELYERTLLSDHERQLAANDETLARARRDQARAALRQAELALERSRLLAPFSGVVTELKAAPGMAVRNDLAVTPLVYMIDRGAVCVYLTVAERRLTSLPPGRELTVRLGARQLPARVVAVEPLGNAGAPLFQVVVAFSRPPGDLRPGGSVRVEID